MIEGVVEEAIERVEVPVSVYMAYDMTEEELVYM